MSTILNIKKLENGLDLPTPVYQTSGAVGFDLYASIGEDKPLTLIRGGHRLIIPTGIAVEVPQGYELQIRPRSGLAAKYGISIVNTPGTIDQDYRGEIKVTLINTDQFDDFKINRGDRIAQAVLSPITIAEIVVVDELSTTDRGNKGLGSTGI